MSDTVSGTMITIGSDRFLAHETVPVVRFSGNVVETVCDVLNLLRAGCKTVQVIPLDSLNRKDCTSAIRNKARELSLEDEEIVLDYCLSESDPSKVSFLLVSLKKEEKKEE
jgi:hypothetical protein